MISFRLINIKINYHAQKCAKVKEDRAPIEPMAAMGQRISPVSMNGPENGWCKCFRIERKRFFSFVSGADYRLDLRCERWKKKQFAASVGDPFLAALPLRRYTGR